jgi:hypothetical protein
VVLNNTSVVGLRARSGAAAARATTPEWKATRGGGARAAARARAARRGA